jgi:hypothetical protein
VEWTYERLSNFLAAPKKYISGTSMGFAGLKKIEDRANLLAYLRTVADTPPAPAGRVIDRETPNFALKPGFMPGFFRFMKRIPGIAAPFKRRASDLLSMTWKQGVSRRICIDDQPLLPFLADVWRWMP